ncbi:MAG: GNAT family N-acetyltransferase [Gemmataceae bacterium]
MRPDLRQSGLGKLLLSHALRFLQDQFFAVAELQVVASNTAGLGLCRGLGFEEVDTGHVYRRPAEVAQ